jgi:hypothetical protein
MASAILASKAVVQICVSDQDDSTSHQYTMDLSLDGNTFYCKLIASARLNSSAKKVPVYLFLDAGYVDSLEICDNQTEVIPRSVASAFVERAVCAAPDDIIGLRFRLKCDAPLFAPDSLLKTRRSTCLGIKNLLQIGRHETFIVYMSSSAIDSERLSRLCLELSKGTLRPVPEGIIKSRYHPDTTSRLITHLDQLSSLYSPELPPYDPSTAPGASNDEASQSGPQPPTGSRAHGKRRSVSPAVHQTPSKRQLLTEKPVLEPWQLAIAAQAAQIAALSAELSALREQVQQLQRAPSVDAGTQTDPVVEHEPETTPETDLVLSPVYLPAHSPVHSPVYSLVYSPVYPPVFNSQATVEITIDERIIILEENMDERLTKLEQDIVDEQTQRSRLNEKIVQNNQLVCVYQMIPSILSPAQSLHLFPSHCEVSSQSWMFLQRAVKPSTFHGLIYHLFPWTRLSSNPMNSSIIYNHSPFKHFPPPPLHQRLSLPQPPTNLPRPQHHRNLDLNTTSLEFLVEELNSRIVDLESDLCDDLRKEFNDSIDEKGSELQIKLEEFCEERLAEVEEIVTHDVRIAFENASCKINLEWVD